MTSADRRTALVTGASGGIGEALARELAGGGCDLILVARSVAALDALGAELSTAHGVAATSIGADLAAPGAGQALARDLKTRGLTVDVLVNNAGFADFGDFVDADLDTLVQMVTLNVTTLTELTHELVRDPWSSGAGAGCQRGLHRGLHARTAHGRLLRHQGLRAELQRGDRRGAQRHRGDGHRAVPGTDRLGVPGPRRDGGLQAGQGQEGDGRGHRGPPRRGRHGRRASPSRCAGSRTRCRRSCPASCPGA